MDQFCTQYKQEFLKTFKCYVYFMHMFVHCTLYLCLYKQLKGATMIVEDRDPVHSRC